jgi:hypothetical protein
MNRLSLDFNIVSTGSFRITGLEGNEVSFAAVPVLLGVLVQHGLPALSLLEMFLRPVLKLRLNVLLVAVKSAWLLLLLLLLFDLLLLLHLFLLHLLLLLYFLLLLHLLLLLLLLLLLFLFYWEWLEVNEAVDIFCRLFRNW